MRVLLITLLKMLESVMTYAFFMAVAARFGWELAGNLYSRLAAFLFGRFRIKI